MSLNGSCESYNACVDAKKKHMEFPIDNESLYAKRFYDTHTANKRCYDKNPNVEYVEGFDKNKKFRIGNLTFSLSTLLKWLVGILLVVLIVMLLQGTKVEVKLNIETPQAPATPIAPPATEL